MPRASSHIFNFQIMFIHRVLASRCYMFLKKDNVLLISVFWSFAKALSDIHIIFLSGDRAIESTASGFSDPHDLPTTSHPQFYYFKDLRGSGRIRTYSVSLYVPDLQSGAHPPSEQHSHIYFNVHLF